MKAADTMQAAVQRYLHERRELGFELYSPGYDLMRFARFADDRGHRGPLTQELQIGWARQHVRRTGSGTATWRLQILRPFASYYRQFEVDTEVVPPGFLGRRQPRPTPHIYTEKEIHDLMELAGRLPPPGGLRPLMYRTLFGLLAAAGLRISEALKLRVADVDLQRARITVRATKFHKSRCLPLHASVVQALAVYCEVRDRHADPGDDAPYFVSHTGGTLSKHTVDGVFGRLRSRLGWRARGDYAHPRLHDLRHTMVARRLQLWHESGASVDHAMFWLCTYLGHARISSTYWYLTGVPELMNIVGTKFERFALEGVDYE